MKEKIEELLAKKLEEDKEVQIWFEEEYYYDTEEDELRKYQDYSLELRAQIRILKELLN